MPSTLKRYTPTQIFLRMKNGELQNTKEHI